MLLYKKLLLMTFGTTLVICYIMQEKVYNNKTKYRTTPTILV